MTYTTTTTHNHIEKVGKCYKMTSVNIETDENIVSYHNTTEAAIYNANRLSNYFNVIVILSLNIKK